MRTRSLIVGIAVLGLAITTQADGPSTPVAPRNPIEIETVIANTATASEKLSVILVVQITRTSLEPSITLRSGGFSGNIREITLESAPWIAKSLRDASQAITDQKKFSEEKGDVTVEATDLAKTDVVGLRKGDGFSSAAIYLPPEEAEKTADALEKALGVWAWMESRVGALQK